MNWEKVKGFCRRQTQYVSEKYRGARSTRDDQTESCAQQSNAYRVLARSTADRMDRIRNNLVDTVASLEALKEDMYAVQHADMADTGKRIEMLCLDLRAKTVALAEVFKQHTDGLRQYVTEASQLDRLLEDRKTKMLEYDFFVNKVDELRRNPPGDPTRIPRNEGRIVEWKALYEDSNERCKQLGTSLIQTGHRKCMTACFATVADLGKLFEESGRSTRVLFPAGSGPPAGSTGMGAVPLAAAAAAGAAAPYTPAYAGGGTAAPPVAQSPFGGPAAVPVTYPAASPAAGPYGSPAQYTAPAPGGGSATAPVAAPAFLAAQPVATGGPSQAAGAPPQSPVVASAGAPVSPAPVAATTSRRTFVHKDPDDPFKC